MLSMLIFSSYDLFARGWTQYVYNIFIFIAVFVHHQIFKPSQAKSLSLSPPFSPSSGLDSLPTDLVASDALSFDDDLFDITEEEISRLSEMFPSYSSVIRVGGM